MNVEIFKDAEGKLRYKFELRFWSIKEPSEDTKDDLSKTKVIEAKYRYLFNVLKQHRIIKEDEVLNFVNKEYTPDEINEMISQETRIT